MVEIPMDKRPEEIWIRGWLKRKPFCYNPDHPHYNPILDKLVRDLNKGLNRVIVIVGDPRTGKSCFSMWLQCYLNWCYFGREEYRPSPDNIYPLKDLFWELPEFIKASKDPENSFKFITQEEQGVEQYAKDWQTAGVQRYDKLTQIFGIDQTNPIINLPYLFDLFKGTRLKAHYVYRTRRMSKRRVDLIMCSKWMSISTEIAKFYPNFRWNRIPYIGDRYPLLTKLYDSLKKQYNMKKKAEFSKA